MHKAINPIIVVSLFCLTTLAGCTQESASSPWFGVALPPGIGDPHAPTVDVSQVQAPGAAVPEGEATFTELAGARIFTDVDAVVEFSRRSRADGNRVWGRITGFDSHKQTVNWIADQFTAAGLSDVAVQEYNATADMWWPQNWEVKVLGNAAFGTDTHDIVLETSLPTGESYIDGGTLIASPVMAGHITEAIPEQDFTGRIAVQVLTPETGAYSERTPTRERAQQLMARGAVAVINIVEQTGNMHTRDFSNCNGPCFNIGTADGNFLTAIIGKAEAAELQDQLQLQLSLQASMLSGLQGQNTVGVVLGKTGPAGENVIVNAHADGWYDAAGDNADGLAVLLAMARHFAQPAHQPERNLVFVASGGHHSTGLNGPANFVNMNPALVANTVLVLNLEHIAQFEIRSADWSVGPGEQPMSFSITNAAPYLTELASTGMARYGFNLNPDFRTAAPGDLGGYRPLGVPMIQAIHSGPMYHASGDVLDTISVPGLERAARFYTYFIHEVTKADRMAIAPE